MDYKKGDRVVINSAIETEERDDERTHYLNKGEVFECVDVTQPDFMEYLNVWCNKRNIHFVLPMDIIKTK